MADDDDDLLEGCGILDFAEDPTTDEELPYEVLFASVREEHRGFFGKVGYRRALEKKADEWRELFADRIGDPT